MRIAFVTVPVQVSSTSELNSKTLWLWREGGEVNNTVAYCHVAGSHGNHNFILQQGSVWNKGLKHNKKKCLFLYFPIN